MLMQVMNATDVRKEFSSFVDTVARQKPVMFKRNRDYVMSLSADQMMSVLEDYSLTADFTERDGIITATLEGFDLIAEGRNKKDATVQLAKELIDYAQDYFDDFQLYYNSSNRRKHFPYVLKVMLLNSVDEVEKIIHA